MAVTNKRLQAVVWGVLGATIAAVTVAFAVAALRPAGQPLPVYGTMSDFSLTNELGHPISLSDLRGKVWIADVIFTRCGSQCPIMSTHLKAIQDLLPANLPIRFVTFTTDPTFDAPPVLKQYAERYGADQSRWEFLTGDKPAMRQAIVDGLKLTVMDKSAAQADNPNDLFIHSAKFVLIDGQGRVRGYFDGETEAAIAQTADAAKRLAAAQ